MQNFRNFNRFLDIRHKPVTHYFDQNFRNRQLNNQNWITPQFFDLQGAQTTQNNALLILFPAISVTSSDLVKCIQGVAN